MAGEMDLVWNLTHRRNPHFTGREQPLAYLREALLTNDASQKIQIVHGLGGVGKTQLAIEYAYRHRNAHGIIWWITADDVVQLASAYARLASRLGKIVTEDASVEYVRDVVRNTLGTRSDWLLIFDNVSDFGLVRRFLPERITGNVIITSRNADWNESDFTTARGFALKPMEREESILFLQRRSKQTGSRDQMERLAKALGDLPLALAQAAACMDQAQMSFGDYIKLFETHWAELLEMGQSGSHEYPATVAMTWELSFRRVEEANPAAADLLDLCSFLNAEGISRKFLRDGCDHLPPNLAAVAMQPLVLDETITALRTYSLIEADDSTLSVHRLVAMLTRDRLTDTERNGWAGATIKLLAKTFWFDSTDIRSWVKCAELMPHVLVTTGHAERLKVAADDTGGLLNDAGHYLMKRGQLNEAKALLERAMKIQNELYGEDSPRVSSVANNLGRVAQRLGDNATAARYFEQALSVDQAAYGHAHPHVAELINNYALCLQARGETETATKQFKWAMDVYEAKYGPDHPKLANLINNVGYMLKSSGDFAGARMQFERALSLAENTLGPSHPTVATILFNLAGVHMGEGRAATARACLDRALTIDQSALGPNHPDVARDTQALADLLKATGQPAAARPYLERAAAIAASCFGEHHARTIYLREQLAAV